jgi:selenocysteine lyase/cysteine desulfurase
MEWEGTWLCKLLLVLQPAHYSSASFSAEHIKLMLPVPLLLHLIPLQHFWGGGTVSLATSSDNFHVLKCRPADKLEDGTVNFLDIIALKHGFQMFERLGGIKAIQAHVGSLTRYLYSELASLKHTNGRPMLEIFGKHAQPDSMQVQGGILNFELLKPNGGVFSYKTFEREAADAGFHVRTGAACNPGACYAELGIQVRLGLGEEVVRKRLCHQRLWLSCLGGI